MDSVNNAQKELQELIALIKKLRAPDGCPWDQKQTKQDIGKYLLDESYEVLDALAENNPRHLQEELGDLLFQILFIAEIASQSGEFSLADVMAAVKEKMIRRHPHVFGDVKVHSVREVKENWQEIKKTERGGKTLEDNLFGNIPRSLPALKRAQKITNIAARHGFDWQNTDDVLKKLHEELNELERAREEGDAGKIEEELGDIFFTLVNLSRFLSVDAETATNGTINKFLRRFAYIAGQLAARGKSPAEATLDEMDSLWNDAKEKRL
ncbi:MAG TPA: nucleoside triphosphate pyrophosphohydrolase, partial [Smithellaceae bacterium]|nr:nucleoside triphosphate pyrophosphohydrolase [Smithellaceae bacterium]HRY38115.1 nucleoside triphosphate pyrophosphohydrolase [Smithellaceae bacterium]